MASPQQIGARIRDAREALGLTQAQLAAQIGVHKNRISQWENGHVRRMKLPSRERLGAILGIPASELVLDGAGGTPAPSNVSTPKPASLPGPPGERPDELQQEVDSLRAELAVLQDEVRTLAGLVSERGLDAQLREHRE